MKIGRKLTTNDVAAIRSRYKEGVSQGFLARAYCVSINTVGRIIRYEAWNEPQEIILDKPVENSPELEAAALESQRRMLQSLDGLLDKGDSDA